MYRERDRGSDTDKDKEINKENFKKIDKCMYQRYSRTKGRESKRWVLRDTLALRR